MASPRKYTSYVHALPVVAAVLAFAFFVPRTSKRDVHVSAPDVAPAEPPRTREPPSTKEEGLINWATDRGAKVHFKTSRQILPRKKYPTAILCHQRNSSYH
jgi:hypothetical protein